MKNNPTKFILTAILCVILMSTTKAQTIINGVIGIDSTLSLANSPYQVTGNLLVMPNITLTIEPGVVVKFDANVELLLRGKLIANGTLIDTITFSSNLQSTGSWAGITIDNYANAKVECSYLKGKYAYVLFWNKKTIGADTTIKLTHCVLDSNNYAINNSNYLNNYTKVYCDSCIFSNNPVVCGTAWGSTFKNSLLYNGSRGIQNNNSSTLGSIVDNCILHDFDYVTLSGKGVITNCTVYDNVLGVEASSLGPTLHYNNIYQNTTGVLSSNTTINPAGQITQNRICNNATNVDLWYFADFNIMNNCWCLSDSAQIRSTMHDFFVQSGLGIVNFTPFDTTCSFITNVQNLIEPNYDFQIYPNPTSNNLTLILPSNISTVALRIFNTFSELESSSSISMPITNIDVSALESGIHILEITDEKNISRCKFIKQ